MRLRELINTDKAYRRVETEIRAWVESSYPGLSIEFNWPAPEVVQTDSTVRFTKPRVRRIVEAVNVKIGDVLEAHAEEIYIADLLDRIRRKHPDYDPEVRTVEDVKTDQRFLRYVKELSVG